MASTKLGRQTPTQSVTLPYGQTDGPQAVALYEQTGRASMPWQQLLIYDMLARDAEGLWVHPKFGYSVPRRNGKNEVVTMREMYGLKNGETILHTAHRTTTSHAAWERLCSLLDKGVVWVDGHLSKRDKSPPLAACNGVTFRYPIPTWSGTRWPLDALAYNLLHNPVSCP